MHSEKSYKIGCTRDTGLTKERNGGEYDMTAVPSMHASKEGGDQLLGGK